MHTLIEQQHNKLVEMRNVFLLAGAIYSVAHRDREREGGEER